MRRCDIDRLPGRYALRRGIAVDIAIANGSNRSPERVMELRVEDGDQRVHLSDREQRDAVVASTTDMPFSERRIWRASGWFDPGTTISQKRASSRVSLCAFRAVLAA